MTSVREPDAKGALLITDLLTCSQRTDKEVVGQLFDFRRAFRGPELSSERQLPELLGSNAVRLARSVPKGSRAPFRGLVVPFCSPRSQGVGDFGGLAFLRGSRVVPKSDRVEWSPVDSPAVRFYPGRSGEVEARFRRIGKVRKPVNRPPGSRMGPIRWVFAFPVSQ